MREINYHYTITNNGFEIDLREMPLKCKMQVIFGLLLNKKIEIYGKNKVNDTIIKTGDESNE